MSKERPSGAGPESLGWTVHPAIAVAAFFGGGVLGAGVVSFVTVGVLVQGEYALTNFVLLAVSLVPLIVINALGFAIGLRFVPSVWWRHSNRFAWLAGGLGLVMLLITPLVFMLKQNFGCFLLPLIAAGVTVLALRGMLRGGVLRPKPAPGVCVWCGHDLTGAISDRCPECGEPRVGGSSAP